jgi:GNAT superfamily N-acetyltransferase
MHIRQARVEEAEALTALMRRSKAHWGYDSAFMEAALPYLLVTAEAVESGLVWVLIDEDALAGFSYLRPTKTPGEILLSDLFIDPAHLGKGYGRVLWDHAISTAREMGFEAMVFDSDPNATGFYLRMGAVQIGETESTVQTGRMLPLMRYVL